MISHNSVFELQQRLLDVTLHGVQIGASLTHTYDSILHSSEGHLPYRGFFSDFLRFLYHLARYSTHSDPTKHVTTNTPYLLTWLNPKHHSSEMILPLVSELGPSRCTVVGTQESMFQHVDHAAHFLTFARLRVSGQHWRLPVFQKLPNWIVKVLKSMSASGIPLLYFFSIMNELLVRSQYIIGFLKLFNRGRFRAVITEFDRNPHAAPLILTAKQLGIGTATMVHGAINPPFGYTPVLSDNIMVWGKRQRSQLLDMGVDSRKIRITGNPRFNPEIKAAPETGRMKLGINANTRTVLFAANPISISDRLKLAQVFCSAYSQTSEFLAVVRLHPSEKIQTYSSIAHEFPDVIFTANNDLTNDEAFAMADVVVVRDSTFGNEAILKGKPVVVLDALPYKLSNGEDLCNLAHCPKAKNASDLFHVTNCICKKPEYRKKLRDHSKPYVSELFEYYGNDATRQIAGITRSIASFSLKNHQ